ncbi:MAG: hypothetical protein JSW63_00790 [Ignavibacterium sp.]|nr:MAG: hypothetical protein JSW63_00790 [Ignavibacterium sp.]
MDKEHIIREIKRIAAENGDIPPGRLVFERETGIKQSDWYPHLWLRWSEAQVDAGYEPRELQSKIEDSELIEHYINLVRELDKLPVIGEIRRKAKDDKSFPSHTVFNRFGGKKQLIEVVTSYCKDNSGFEDVLELCESYLHSSN